MTRNYTKREVRYHIRKDGSYFVYVRKFPINRKKGEKYYEWDGTSHTKNSFFYKYRDYKRIKRSKADWEIARRVKDAKNDSVGFLEFSIPVSIRSNKNS